MLVAPAITCKMAGDVVQAEGSEKSPGQRQQPLGKKEVASGRF